MWAKLLAPYMFNFFTRYTLKTQETTRENFLKHDFDTYRYLSIYRDLMKFNTKLDIYLSIDLWEF